MTNESGNNDFDPEMNMALHGQVDAGDSQPLEDGDQADKPDAEQDQGQGINPDQTTEPSTSRPELTVTEGGAAELEGHSPQRLGEDFLQSAEAAAAKSQEDLDADAQRFFSRAKLQSWLKGIGSALGGAVAAGLATAGGFGLNLVMPQITKNISNNDPTSGPQILVMTMSTVLISLGIVGTIAGAIKALEARHELSELAILKSIRERHGEEDYRNVKKNQGFE